METLEEIFWKQGKFVDKKDKELKTESIGNPVIIYNHERNSPNDTQHLIINKVLELQKKDIAYSEANGYCLGERVPSDLQRWENDRNTSVQLYKISL